MRVDVRVLGGLVIATCLSGELRAQEEPPPAEPSVEARLESLEAELDALRAEDDAGDDDLYGWQIQLRGGGFHLAHNHRDDIVAGGSDSQYGWNVGLGISAPIWPGLGPVDLAATVEIEFRQVRYSPDFSSPVVAALGGPPQRGSIDYLNVMVLPTIRLPLADGVFTPFVCLGFNMQVASPPKDAITYLDLGFTVGLGFEVRVHPRISLGTDYKWTWFGVGDQEDEDYGFWAAYVGFNF